MHHLLIPQLSLLIALQYLLSHSIHINQSDKQHHEFLRDSQNASIRHLQKWSHHHPNGKQSNPFRLHYIPDVRDHFYE